VEPGEVSPADRDAYFKALVDAEVADEDEITLNLLAVVPGRDSVNQGRLHGDELVWEGRAEESRILVVSFMSRATYEQYYEPFMGAPQYLLRRNIWVTVVPEMRYFFMGRPCPPTCSRLKKLLGLNPAFDYEVLVEMWVHPDHLFRPTPDAEITDHRAELALWRPQDPGPQPLGTYSAFTLIDEGSPVSYQTWYAGRAKTSYTREGDDPSFWGWPWTRLGYTYDWGNPDDPAGLSEFVVRIDPDTRNLSIRLERAVFCGTPEWDGYFRCSESRPEELDDSYGCFMSLLI
jgi:hypothetical protein